MGINYTKEEEDLIKSLYVNGGSIPLICSKLPNRNKKSIQHKIRKLGLNTKINPKPYCQYEDDVIKRHFDCKNKTKSASYIQTLLPTRSIRSIMGRALTLGVSNSRNWTAEEDGIVRQFYDTRNAWISCENIKNKYLPYRSINSIRQRACAIGLTRPRITYWDDDELEILHTYGESLPLAKIMCKLRKVWDKKGLKYRTSTAVSKKLQKLEYSRKFEGGYYSIEQLADALGCSRKFIRQLYAQYKDVLKPEKLGKYHVVQDTKLIKFIMKYPGEIAKVKPDIIWLVGLLSPDHVLISDNY